MQTDKPACKIITIEQDELTTLILNDVQNNNALDVDMISELCQAIRLSNKTLLLRANGDNFCYGAKVSQSEDGFIEGLGSPEVQEDYCGCWYRVRHLLPHRGWLARESSN